MRVNYAMVFVSDMKRAVAFYRDALGLPLRFESPHWTEVDAGVRGREPAEPRCGACRRGLTDE